MVAGEQYTGYITGNYCFPTGTFSQFWAKMYRLRIVFSKPVHLRPKLRKSACSDITITSWYIFAILGENVPDGNYYFPTSTYSQFSAKMCRLCYCLMASKGILAWTNPSPQEPQTHPFQTPSKLGHVNSPSRTQLQAAFPSHKTSCKMEQAMNGDGRHPRHHTLNNVQASFRSIVS